MKKQSIVVAVMLLAVGAIVTLSIYKYNRQPKDITVSQAVSQRDTALADLKIQKSLNQNDQTAITNLTADKKALTTANTTLTSTNATLCAQIRAAKLVQPLCK
jgi:hypothetical protein